MQPLASRENIQKALGTLLKEEPLLPILAPVLEKCRQHEGISFGQALWIAGNDAAEVMLLAWDWKLLLPRRSVKCAEWDHRVMRFEPDEHYEMANIVRVLLDMAAASGSWETGAAIDALYTEMGEPKHAVMPELVRGIVRSAENENIDADAIHGVCVRNGLGDRTGSLIAILKGGGIISPKLADINSSGRRFSPIYEVHPAVSRGSH